MVVLCKICDTECISYSKWIKHLLSKRHQDKSKENIDNWTDDYNERSIVVRYGACDSRQKQPTAASNINFFCQFTHFGFVRDIYLDPFMKFCVIRFDKKENNMHTLKMEGKQHIGGVTFYVQRKADIPSAAWLLLNAATIQADRKELFGRQHLELIDLCSNNRMDVQLELFVDRLAASSIEETTKNRLLLYIKSVLEKDFPECTVSSHGSIITKTSSALCIYVDASVKTLGNETSKKCRLLKKEVFEKIQEILTKENSDKPFCYNLMVMPTKEVPTIKFTDLKSGLKCYLTIEKLLPVKQNDLLISLFTKLDARVSYLITIIQYWCRFHKLTGINLIPEDAMTFLLFIFLCKKDIIPSPSVLQLLSRSPPNVNDTLEFCTDLRKIHQYMLDSGLKKCSVIEINYITGSPTAKSILVLAKQFFEMYAHLDLEFLVLSPFVGKYIAKELFTSGNETNLPDELHRYNRRTDPSNQNYKLNTASVLCVQDPFDLGLNICCNCPSQLVYRFQFLCADAAENIQSILTSSSPKLMDMFNVETPSSAKATMLETLSSAKATMLETPSSAKATMQVDSQNEEDKSEGDDEKLEVVCGKTAYFDQNILSSKVTWTNKLSYTYIPLNSKPIILERTNIFTQSMKGLSLNDKLKLLQASPNWRPEFLPGDAAENLKRVIDSSPSEFTQFVHESQSSPSKGIKYMPLNKRYQRDVLQSNPISKGPLACNSENDTKIICLHNPSDSEPIVRKASSLSTNANVSNQTTQIKMDKNVVKLRKERIRRAMRLLKMNLANEQLQLKPHFPQKHGKNEGTTYLGQSENEN